MGASLGARVYISPSNATVHDALRPLLPAGSHLTADPDTSPNTHAVDDLRFLLLSSQVWINPKP